MPDNGYLPLIHSRHLTQWKYSVGPLECPHHSPGPLVLNTLFHGLVIAEREVRQLIVVQSQLVYICLSMCNAQECSKYLIQSTACSFSAHSLAKPDPPCACKGLVSPDYSTHVVLTISGHELLFISLHFMVQNDYGFRGCMMNTLTML